MIQYELEIDHRTGDFQIVRWKDFKNRVVVQTGIKTTEKAFIARDIWRQREREKHVAKNE